MKNVELSINFIFSLLEQCGFNSYDGEPITQLDHALQCAFWHYIIMQHRIK